MRDRKDDVLLIAGIAALALGMGIGRFSYTLLLPTMTHVSGFTTSTAAAVASWNYVGYLVGALLAGLERLRRRRVDVVRVSLVVSTLSLALMASSSNGIWWSALRLIGGIASAFIFVFTSAMVLDRARELGRASWSGFLYSGVGVGILMTALFMGAASRYLDFRGAWLSMAGLSAALVFIAAAGLRAVTAPETFARASLDGTASGRLRLIYAAFFAESIGYVIPATFIVYFVNGDPKLQPYRILVWGIVGAFAAPSTVLWARFARGRRPASVAALAMLVQAGGIAVELSHPSLWGALVLAATLGFTFVAITSFVIRAACDISPLTTGATVSRLTAVFGVGQIVGPLVAAMTLHRIPGTNGALVAAFVVLVFGTVMLSYASPRRNS